MVKSVSVRVFFRWSSPSVRVRVFFLRSSPCVRHTDPQNSVDPAISGRKSVRPKKKTLESVVFKKLLEGRENECDAMCELRKVIMKVCERNSRQF